MNVFEINDFGVVMNPNEIIYYLDKNIKIIIKTASINNLWYWGADYTGYNEGFGYPVMANGKSFNTESEAIDYVKNYLKDRFQNIKNTNESQLTFEGLLK